MHTKRIIPCLDVHNGRVVKGVNFVNLQDAGDPVEIGEAYDKEPMNWFFLILRPLPMTGKRLLIWFVKLRRRYLYRLP